MTRKSKQTKEEPDIEPQKRSLVSGRGLSHFSLFFRVCKECGVPRAVSSNHLWEDYGTILSRDSAQRLIIVERKILDGILNKVSEIFGEVADDTFLYAKAFDASHYIRSIMKGWSKVAAGYPLTKRPYYELLCDNARILGIADAKVVAYKRGKEVVISCTNCYNEVLFAGDILGAVFVGEGKEAAIETKETNGELIFTATVLENDRFKALEKFSFSWEVPLPGHINYKRCRRCGIPFAVSFFSWDIPRGIIVDTHNGEPVTLVDVAGINAAYEEFRAEIGSEVDDFLAGEVKKMIDGILPGLEWKHRRPEEMIRDLFFLAYRGMGNPIFTESIGDGIKARVENPFNYPLVAGIVTSFLARGRPVTFEWERSMPGRLEVYLHFQ